MKYDTNSKYPPASGRRSGAAAEKGGPHSGGAPGRAGGTHSSAPVYRRPEEAGRPLCLHRGRVPAHRRGTGGGADREKECLPGAPQALSLSGGEAALPLHARGGGHGAGGPVCRPVSGPERASLRGAGAGAGCGLPYRSGGALLGLRPTGSILQRPVRRGRGWDLL